MNPINPFFQLPNGEFTQIYSLRNAEGFGCDIADWGGTVVNLLVPDRKGQTVDVALGWRDPRLYYTNPGCLGATIGRVANRIAHGAFTLDGENYQLMLNDKAHHCALHGAFGYHLRRWRAELYRPNQLRLFLTSPHGDAGFPGNLEVEVHYTFTENNALVIEYFGETDRPTLFNPTNHLYFNLNGEESGNTLDHVIALNAAYRTAVDADLIPTGELLAVQNTPYDLRDGQTLAEIARAIPGGLDDNYCLREKWNENCAAVAGPKRGIVLKVSTTAPGIQFYMAGGMSSGAPGKGAAYGPFAGFCLETQIWPDAVNHVEFPSCRLEPEDKFYSKTVYQFANC